MSRASGLVRPRLLHGVRRSRLGDERGVAFGTLGPEIPVDPLIERAVLVG
jgi:hypothetical protein